MHDIQIYTERLLLRPLKIADVEDVFERVRDERVSRYASQILEHKKNSHIRAYIRISDNFAY